MSARELPELSRRFSRKANVRMWRFVWLLFATINCMVYGCEGSWFFGSSSPLVPKTKVENLQKALMAPMAPTAPVAPAAPKLVSTEILFSLFFPYFPNFTLC